MFIVKKNAITAKLFNTLDFRIRLYLFRLEILILCLLQYCTTKRSQAIELVPQKLRNKTF